VRAGLLFSFLVLVASQKLVLVACESAPSDQATKENVPPTASAAGSSSLADQCRVLIETINSGNEAVKPTDSSAPEVDPVKGMEALDKKLAELALTDAALVKHVAEYRAMNREMIALTKEFDAAIPSASASASASTTATASAGMPADPALEALEARMTKVTSTELRLVTALNALCD